MSRILEPRTDMPVLVYSTFPSQEEAERIGGDLVDRGLAACANIIPGMTSIYVWEGKRHRETECVMILKTRSDLADKVTEDVARLASYANPAVLVLPVIGGSRDFMDWIEAQTVAGK